MDERHKAVYLFLFFLKIPLIYFKQKHNKKKRTRNFNITHVIWFCQIKISPLLMRRFEHFDAFGFWFQLMAILSFARRQWDLAFVSITREIIVCFAYCVWCLIVYHWYWYHHCMANTLLCWYCILYCLRLFQNVAVIQTSIIITDFLYSLNDNYDLSKTEYKIRKF